MRVSLGGFLHDLGKIAVPDAILNKPDQMTDDEYEIIKTHPDVGGRLLIDHPLADLAQSAVFAHHERPDGTGYPQQLPLDQISVDARIAGHSEQGIPLHDCPMCGASIVISRHQHEGGHAYCRACGAEARIHAINGNTVIKATGQRGTPAQLEPGIDHDLIRELVRNQPLS
ncbi:MAG: HD domain-containing protein [Gallionella sp.]|nr:HD domain-containing protein [Gallionella sp.]